jgi:hypothetical protein
MTDDQTNSRSPSKAVWIIAYLLSPAIPFLCLRYARAIGTKECLCGAVIALIAHMGLVSVLSATDGNALQIFVVLLLGASLFIIVLWQFLAGQRIGLWSARAKRQWKIAGQFFGGLLGVGLVLGIVNFHLLRHLDSEHSWIQNPQAGQSGGGNSARLRASP